MTYVIEEFSPFRRHGKLTQERITARAALLGGRVVSVSVDGHGIERLYVATFEIEEAK